MTENCSLVARLYAHAREAPLNSAIVTPSDTITYRELAQLVLAQAEVLYRKGIIESTSVGICCEDQVQHLIYSLALDHIGATSFSVPTYESRASQLAMLQQGNADVELDETFASDVLGSGTSHKLAYLTQPALAIEDSHSRHDAALLFTTSGTSGKPKLVIHHSSDLVAQAHRHIQSPQERFACLANIQHNFAKRHRLYCVAMGACNVFIDNAPESIVNDCLRTGITALHVSAIQAQALLAAKETDKLSHICLKLGGSHVPLTLRAELRNRITQQLKAGYGTTETGAIAFTDPDDEQAGESVGQPLPGIEVQIVDTNKSPLGVGQQGEIAIRCKGMFRGYFKQEEQTQLRLQNGWFFTGDIGYLDDKQRIFVCGRRDDMFVFNSMNIYPQDIEAVLCQHPMVLDAAVVPKESANHGNIPVALVVPNTKSEASKQSIEQFSQDRLGSRCPRQFILVERIPRNSSGKISRKEAQIEAHKRPLTRDRLRQTLADVLSTTSRINIKPALLKAFEQSHKDIFIEDLTLDSLARMNLLVALEVNHGVLINFEELAQLDSLEQLVELALAADSECSQHKSSSMPFSARSIARSTNAAYAGAPYAVRLFWRLLRRCDSITAFNKASHLLKHRLTPAQCQELIEQHGRAELIPEMLDQALKSAIIVWLQHFDILFQQE